MDIFLSYASENRPRAEEIALSLRNEGHEVFFDRSGLEGGENYHRVIRERLAAADLLVFLVSRAAIEPGKYTLSELRAAEERWPSPAGHVVPVLIEPTPLASIPAYLRAVTLFESKGNVAAELSAHIADLAARSKRRVWLRIAAVALVLMGIGLGAWRYLDRHQEESTSPAFVSSIEESDFVTLFVMNGLERTEYALDPTSRVPVDRGDVVRLERIAFGRLPNGPKGFSIRVSVNNPGDDPIQLDLTTRFFELIDDQGRQAKLLYFCCEARGDLLPPKQQRVLHLIYAAPPGWEGKETTPGFIHFRVSGLLPIVRAAWSFRPLATAA